MTREPIAVAEDFLAAFNEADLEGMRRCLAAHLQAHVTDQTGSQKILTDSSAYIDAIEGMDLQHAAFSVQLTQDPVLVEPDLVLLMVEVHAQRNNKTLHNYAAHLMRISDGRITELHMTDAKPAESDQFWSQ